MCYWMTAHSNNSASIVLLKPNIGSFTFFFLNIFQISYISITIVLFQFPRMQRLELFTSMRCLCGKTPVSSQGTWWGNIEIFHCRGQIPWRGAKTGMVYPHCKYEMYTLYTPEDEHGTSFPGGLEDHFPFLNGRFVGSMLIFQGVYDLYIYIFYIYIHYDRSIQKSIWCMFLFLSGGGIRQHI